MNLLPEQKNCIELWDLGNFLSKLVTGKSFRRSISLRKLGVLLCILMCMCSAALAAELDLSKFMPVDEIRPGMKGVGKTVFEGTRIDEFQIEVLDVSSAPFRLGDIIWVMCSGGLASGRRPRNAFTAQLNSNPIAPTLIIILASLSMLWRMTLALRSVLGRLFAYLTGIFLRRV